MAPVCHPGSDAGLLRCRCVGACRHWRVVLVAGRERLQNRVVHVQEGSFELGVLIIICGGRVGQLDVKFGL